MISVKEEVWRLMRVWRRCLQKCVKNWKPQQQEVRAIIDVAAWERPFVVDPANPADPHDLVDILEMTMKWSPVPSVPSHLRLIKVSENRRWIMVWLWQDQDDKLLGFFKVSCHAIEKACCRPRDLCDLVHDRVLAAIDRAA